MQEKRYISVILPLKLEWTPCYWTDRQIEPGSRVRVVFSGKEYVGVVENTDITPDIDEARILQISSVEEGIEKVLAEEIELWRRIADYYLCTIGEVYKLAYPVTKIKLEHARAEARRLICQRKEKLLASVASKLDKTIERLAKKEAAAQKAKDGTKTKYTLLADIEKIKGEIALIEKAKECAQKNLNAAIEGIDVLESMDLQDTVSLSEAQQTAYRQIQTAFKEGKPALLHGVTGSGKTEIYVKLAYEALASGKNVLYLVPEIALSRQLEDRLYEHFGERLLTFHSGESMASRRNSAEIIRNCKNTNGGYIALCTRSGLFLPHHNLGLIIVDEEHDNSYKQDSPAPRYNGRDTALILNSLHSGCNIILGSATPSLEEVYNTQVGRHALIQLKERFHGNAETEIEIIDTKAERRKRGMVGNFSRKLIDRIRETLAAGEQVLILRTRRAFSTALQCINCGDIPKCPHCNVSLNFHKATGRMVCHYCGHSEVYTGKCRKCEGAFAYLGAGTQKIEEETAALFPEASVARLDSDTTQNKSHESKVIKGFANGEIDILIGTQIITKGFDFSKLTLVAIIAADTLLGVEDFRADEKALHIMEQFRGRCGRRGKAGRFVIQTSQPEHPIYQQISNSENISVTNLLAERKDFDFPPYTRIIELIVRDRNEARADKLSTELASALGARFNTTDQTSLLASPAVTQAYKPVVDRIEDHFIRKIRICFKKDKMLSSNKSALKQLIEKFEKDKKYTDHISIDVDPS